MTATTEESGNAAHRLHDVAQLPLNEQLGGTQQVLDEIMYALDTYSIVVVTDKRGIITHVNDRFCEISKYSRDELLGNTHGIINSGRHPKEFFKEMWRCIGRGEAWSGEICNRAKDGTEYWVDTTIIPLIGNNRKPERYVAIRTEQTQRYRAEERARRLAYFDTVTRLPNRASVMHAVEDVLRGSELDEYCGLITVSLDELSVVNDAFGFEMGDLLLQNMGDQMLVLGSKTGAHIGRIGADAFSLLMPKLGSDPELALRACKGVIERVLSTVNGTSELRSDVVVDVSVSVGYVLAKSRCEGYRAEQALDSDGEILRWIETPEPNDLVKCSEIARKQARRRGGNRRVANFEQRMLEDAKERVRLVAELRRGIENGELRLFSQPIVDRNRRVIGQEGLIRWLSPNRGLVVPGEFIPLAEQTGLIVQIGEWVLEEACRTLAEWAKDPETRDWTFSVNLSERQLRDSNFTRMVQRIIAEHRVPVGKLKFELTESVLHTDLDRTIRLLSMLRAEGVHASLDDFGTGYSSLAYLTRLPVQQLKIDRSFVSAVGEDRNATAVAQMIVQLGSSFGLEVVAEGIETEAQFTALYDLGVDAFQGYLFSRPLPVGSAAPLR